MRSSTSRRADLAPIRRLVLILAFGALAAPLSSPAATGNGWFSGNCLSSTEPFPEHSQRLLLRVLTDPLDPGIDAVLLREPNGQLYAAPDLYAHLQLLPAGPARKVGLDAWFALDAIEQLRYQIDACAQTLSVDRSRVGATRRYVVSAGTDRPAPRSELGGYAQTELQYLTGPDTDVLSGLLDVGVFGTLGLAHSTALYDGEQLLRLDSRYSHDDPGDLRRLSIGDGITRGGVIGRSLRFAGVQWGRDFSLRPDLVTFPLPVIDGVAALPSAVDVYVDNQLRARQDIEAGPFQLSQVPVIAGSGEIQLVVTDLLGRSQVLRYDFYVTPALLSPGLDDYTLEAGFERRRYGQASNRYGRGFAAATWRRGISNQLTGELHLEGSDQRQVAGAALSAQVPVLGVATVGLASGAGDSSGGLMSVSAEKQWQHWSYALDYQRASRGFVRIGEREPGVYKRDSLRLSWHPLQTGSLSATWLDDERVDGSGVRGIALGYSQRLGADWFLTLGGFSDQRRHDHSYFAGLTRPLGRSLSGNLSYDQDEAGGTTRLLVQRNAPDVIGWSARAGIEQGRTERYSAAAAYANSAAQIGADAESREGDTALRLNLQSGVTWLGQDVFVTRPLSGPFAVVETGEVANVRVYTEHRLAGDTGDRGALLVPGLRPYQVNSVSVAEEDYTVDQRLNRFDQSVDLPGYGGVRVVFVPDARVSRRLLLRLGDGTAPPPGADVLIDGSDDRQFTGYDGETLVVADPGLHRLRAHWAGGRCEVDFELGADDTVSRPPLALVCGWAP